jgi:hemerythrin-like domain-containing protein
MKRIICAIAALLTFNICASAQSDIPVTATEDLMREHGIQRRALLVYEKSLKDINSGKKPDYDNIYASAVIVRDFIENYHEKLEVDYIFPLFEDQDTQAELVKTLREQHAAGRKLTQSILELTEQEQPENNDLLAYVLLAYTKMYRPHMAREDTVLYPALRNIISKEGYEELSEKFEDIEKDKFGDDGFKKMVNKVQDIEKKEGIYELAEFTPVQDSKQYKSEGFKTDQRKQGKYGNY